MPKAEGKAPTRARRATSSASGGENLQTKYAEPEDLLATGSASDFFTDMDDTVDFANIVYYGREGAAKTTNGLRMVNSSPTGIVIAINAEGGFKKAALTKRGVDTSRIKVWPKPGMQITHKGLINLHSEISAMLAADPKSVIGVVIDSASEIVQAMTAAVQEKRVRALQRQGKAVDENHVDIADYGDMSKLFRDVIRKFRDLPCHVVITALERRDIDKDTGKPQYGPAVTPGVQTDLLGYPDFVIMCKAEDEDGPFRGLTRSNSRYRAKDRFDVLPRVMVEPTADRIIAYMNGEMTEDTDPFQDDLPERTKHAQDAVPVEADNDEDDSEDDEG